MNIDIQNAAFETHPYNSEPIPADTKALIVGTAPPPRFSLPRAPDKGPKKGYDADFFYGSGANYLWLFLERAAGEKIFAEPGTPEAAREDTQSLMRDFLCRHHIWMRDILQTYRRKPGKEQSAKDDDIDRDAKVTSYVRLLPLFEESKDVHIVVFTSVTAAKWSFENGFSSEADKETQEYYRQRYVAAEAERKRKTGLQKYTDVFCAESINDRLVSYYIAPSPSGSAGPSDIDLNVAIYKSILFRNS